MDISEIIRMDKLDIESEEEWYDAPEEDDQTETFVEQSYITVLAEEDIRRRMENDIKSLSDIFSITEAEATLLLPLFRRLSRVSEFHEEWFDNAKRVRERVGLFYRPPDQPSDDKEFFCGVCLESHLLERSASVSCGHRVCTCCWTRHINKIIGESPPAEINVWLVCPYKDCPASVGRDMIERFASEEVKSKYGRYLLRSYVEESKTMKWCPASGCSFAIDRGSRSGNSDVSCLCLLRFCWNCSEEAHSPVDCRSAAKWLAMNTFHNQSSIWVLANTVPCPNCKRRIEENQDCSLKMTCLPPCNHDFCWHCRKDWTEHGEETGCSLYMCNLVPVSCGETDFQKMAESAADRYRDCYKYWKSNESLMQQAKAYLKRLHTDLIPHLSNIQLATVPQLQFIAEAWSQIMECRRVLKWTNAYEYYLRDDEVEKQPFLKHKQVNAEIPLKKLCHYAENKLQTFLDAEEPSEDFTKFSIKLPRLTSITRNHYESLVRDLEDGLTNVVPASSSQRPPQSEDASGSGLDHDD
uniref:RBR-type E3 ubiquitin transferase n=1 Tax=Noccaea caerulescens TaxID=107243 RepID=A0A1J3K711_NOCCA